MMIILSFGPVFDFLGDYAAVKYSRWSYKRTDAGKCTHEKDIGHIHKSYDRHEFISLFGGPQYEIVYKCANTNIIVFITLIFGPALPILYVVTCWSIFC